MFRSSPKKPKHTTAPQRDIANLQAELKGQKKENLELKDQVTKLQQSVDYLLQQHSDQKDKSTKPNRRPNIKIVLPDVLKQQHESNKRKYEKHSQQSRERNLTQRRQAAKDRHISNSTSLIQTLQDSEYYQQQAAQLSPSAASTAHFTRHCKSQDVVLNKINTYLKLNGKNPLPPKGYCNGFSLLWLTMMAAGTEKLFYKMIDTIAETHDEDLNSIQETIETFLQWIDLGQHPYKHFGESRRFYDLDVIIGVESLESIHQNMTESDLTRELDHYVKPGAMVCVKGWGNTVSGERRSHAIGVYNRDGTFYVFDPNFREGRPRIIPKNIVATQIQKYLFENMGIPLDEKNNIRIDVAKGKVQTKTAANLMSFKSTNDNFQESLSASRSLSLGAR